MTGLRSQLVREFLMVAGSLVHSVTPRPLHEVKMKVSVGPELSPGITIAVIINNNMLPTIY